MGLQITCDACGHSMTSKVATVRAPINDAQGRHLASVTLSCLTRSGAEYICAACMVSAITARLRENAAFDLAEAGA